MSFRNYYDSSYGRNRDTGRSIINTTTEKPTSVTAKYISSSYKASSSIPVLSERSPREESTISSIANRYANYKTDKATTKYDKKDYSKLSIPSINPNRSRDVSPASNSSKYLGRTSRHYSPERRTTKSYKEKGRDPSPVDREKDIPSKTDKSSGYNSLSSYKLYPRSSSYSRPASRNELKTEISANRSRSEIKPEITVNRYAIANRLSSNYLRSPPTIKRTSVSPISSINDTMHKNESEKSVSPTVIREEDINSIENNIVLNNSIKDTQENESETMTITVITRHTSPTPPGSSVYVRTRRADMAKTIEKTIVRSKRRIEMVDKEVQSDRLDDPTRSSRYGSTTRASMSNWSLYSPSTTNYTGYAGRYSTQYSNLRENSMGSPYTDRSSRSRSSEPQTNDNLNLSTQSDLLENNKVNHNSNVERTDEIVTLYEGNKEEDTPEIIINVNLKLKKAKSPNTTELVSPEITITNSQLPPQPPKPEGSTKLKKVKVRKSSTDSSSDSSPKKKIIKKKSNKSGSSMDLDPGSETSESKSGSPQKNVHKSPSKSNMQNSNTKLKHSKSRDSNSRESSVTLSTQSSISEDELASKSKSNDLSQTSADEISIPTDKSGKQSPFRNENGTEEAKSFLIRALAPVTNLFKSKHHDSTDNSHCLETSTSESTGKDISNLRTESSSKTKNTTDNYVASNGDNFIKLKAIRHIESGERACWLENEADNKNSQTNDSQNSNSDKILPRKITHIESGERAWWLESNNESKKEETTQQLNSVESTDLNKPLKKCKYVDEEKPWWLDSSSNIPEGIERLTPPRKSSSESEKGENYNFYKVRHIESGEKDWWLTSNENSSMSNKTEPLNSLSKSASDQRSFPMRRIRHIESGERPWWLASDQNIPEGIEKLPTPPPQPDSDSSDSDEVQVYGQSQIPPFPLHLPDDEPLGDRHSPEGLETPKDVETYGRSSPYENDRSYNRGSIYMKDSDKYISRYTDIDDILGTSGHVYSPFMDSILAQRTGQMAYDDDECEEIDPTQVRIHDSTAQMPVIKKLISGNEYSEDQLDDATLQVFKDGDYGPYLDLDSTLGEQEEELEGLQESLIVADKIAFITDVGEDGRDHNFMSLDSEDYFSEEDELAALEILDSRKNGLIIRTQLSVRVHTIIERLLHSQGRELRRALFTLKQILQSDKDLVHEFVANKGLDCLMQVGSMADHNYLDYIMRALGQILLYVDGMHGVMANQRCVQWLYSLISSRFRHIVKTALKLLLVFVEYTDKNCLLLIDAIHAVDNSNRRQPWYNVTKILQDFDASDTELLIYATTLINRCLNNVPDRDTYYDQVDALQEQGIDDIIQLYMTKQGTDLDLLRQLQIFEAVLLYEDGDETGTALKQLDDSIINSIRRRSNNLNSIIRKSNKYFLRKKETIDNPVYICESKPLATSSPITKVPHLTPEKVNKELNVALRRRRDRYARQAHHITQQQEMLNAQNGFNKTLFHSTTNGHDNTCDGSHTNGVTMNGNNTNTNNNYIETNGFHTNKNECYSPYNRNCNNSEIYYSAENVNDLQSEEDTFHSIKNTSFTDYLKNGNQKYTSGLKQRIQNGTLGHSVNAIDALAVMRQKSLEGTPETKDERGIIINKEHSIKDLAQRLTSPVSQTTEEKPLREEMAGIVSKAKEELAKSQSKEIIKSPTIEISSKVQEIKVSDNDFPWDELRKACLEREFHLCDLDFSDLRHDSDDEDFAPIVNSNGVPPPPPPGLFSFDGAPPPPPPGFFLFAPKPILPKPPAEICQISEVSSNSDSATIKKNKKTVKLFWREVNENPVPITMRRKIGGFIWDDLPDINLDTRSWEQLFESRTNDLLIKKLMEPKRNLILAAKRSNAINIAMKKLPTPQTIKAAIMKMDATVIGREGIEKLMTMLPTEEEKVKIQEAQYANPDLPLGSAEQFLLTLASINELSSRLKLWVFKLDFDNLEKEVAEPLMDLKQGIELLKINKTFKVILSTLRTVGSFLNGSQVKGFHLEYLSKVMEVKDTVHKHPLLHHICEMIIQKFPDTTDFFSEVGPVIRASKVDFDILNSNLLKLEVDCKASWDHMKRVAKHDGSQIKKTKITEFLTDAAQRIILLTTIQKRVMNRYTKFLLYLGVPFSDISKTKPSEFLKVIAEFALEYRTCRERVLQQLEKKANHRERNKTRGKMIIDVGNYSQRNGDNTADMALKELLKADPESDSLTYGRRTRNKLLVQGNVSPDEEIIQSFVRSASSKRKPTVARERRKNRISDKKSLNRTLDGKNP